MEVARHAQGRPRGRADRPRRPSRGRGHDGAVDAAEPAHLPGRNRRRRRRACTSRNPEQHRVRDADHAVDRRHPRDHRRAEAALPGDRRARSTTTSATPPRTARTRCASSAPQCDLVLVVGSPNSSNSNRLRELAEKQGVPAYLIDGAADIRRRNGSKAAPASASPPAPRPRKAWCRDVIARLREARRRRRAANSTANRKTSPSRCPRNCACAWWRNHALCLCFET